MKASLVAYNFGDLHKKSKIKIVKIEYVRGCLEWQSTQIWSLKILGVNVLWIANIEAASYFSGCLNLFHQLMNFSKLHGTGFHC
jgi:hypothetical protein